MPSNPLHVLLTRKSKEREGVANDALQEPPVQNNVASSSSVPDPPQSGLRKLVDGRDPTIDIVAVHGSLAFEGKGWTARNGANWIEEFLPMDIPQARIFSWGYEAKAHSSSTIKSPTLYDHARDLISDLCQERRKTETQRRPIIFVAHSLGGIVVKSALIHSDATRTGALQEHHSIILSTYGVLFLGTPHQGSEGVDLQKLVLRAAKVITSKHTGVFKHLKRDPGWLRQLDGQYESISGGFVTIFAYEMVSIPGKTIVVPRFSAILPGFSHAETIAIPADHANMVRFSSPENEVYQKLHGHLSIFGRDAPGKIGERWEQRDNYIRGIVEMEFSVPFSLSGIPEAQTFVGREKELKEMQEALQLGDDSCRKVVIVQGLGGIGKTQLVVHFLKEVADSYSAIIWLDGKTEDLLKQSFAIAAKRLHKYHPASKILRIAVESKDIDVTGAAVREWLSAEGNHRWLLVFDNFDNPRLPDLENSRAYDLQSYFPETNQGSVIITSRSSRLEIGEIISISKLGVQESLEILCSTSRRGGLDQDPHAQDLVNELDGLPLALATAGAYLKQVPTPLEVYLRHYRASWKKLQTKSPKLMSYQDRTLYTTWNISLAHIEMQGKSAGQLLRLLGYFDNHDIWYELLAAGSQVSPKWLSTIIEDETKFNEAVRVLSDHALIESIKGSGGYSMHSCVHAWIAHVLNAEADPSMVRMVICCSGINAPNHNTPLYWELERRLLPHAQKALKYLCSNASIGAQDDEIFLRALLRLGTLYLDQGKMAESESMYQRALKGFEEVFGPDHILTLATINHLAILYDHQGKTVEAETICQRAMEVAEKKLGPNHASTLIAIHNLGIFYQNQGKMVEAEAMFQRALGGYEKAYGPDHPSTLITVHSRGLLYKDQDKLVEAEALYQRVLKGNEKAFGPDHPSTLSIVNNLGFLYKHQGKMVEAGAMFQRALKGYEKAFGPDHKFTLGTVRNLGTLYTEQGKMAEAEAMYERALEGIEKVFGPDHISTLSLINDLGILYSNQGKMVEAEAMYDRALEGKEKALGPNHKFTLGTVRNLGTLYKDQGKMAEAEAMYQRALQGYEKALGPEHTSTLETVNHLGNFYRDQGKMVEAEVMYQRAMQGFEKTFGPQHPSTLNTISNFGNLYCDQNKMVEAEAMYLRALEGKEKAWGPQHQSTLNTVNNLGSLYRDQKKMVEAEAMYQRALQGFEKALGPEHTSTLCAVNNLGTVYKDQGKMPETEAMYQRALQGYEKLLGPYHQSTLIAVNNLGNLYRGQKKMVEAEAMYQRAVQGFEKALGPEHRSTLGAVFNLGNLYRDQGKMPETEAMYQRALQGYEKVLGPYHRSTLNTIGHLGSLYSDQKKMAEAEVMYQRTLQGSEKAFGPQHPDTLTALNALGRFCRDQGKLVEAEEILKHALEGKEKALGPHHPSTLNTAKNLVRLYYLQNNMVEAHAMYDRVLKGEGKALGS